VKVGLRYYLACQSSLSSDRPITDMVRQICNFFTYKHEEIKRTLNSDNACYHSVQNLLSSRLSKNLKIRKYKTIILPVVLYGCEIWSLTLREEHRLRMFENRVLRRILGPKRDEVTG
jgi:hypothetical protein